MGMDVRSRKLAVNGVIVDFGRETLRTESGHSIALRPQAFAVLRYLAEHAGPARHQGRTDARAVVRACRDRRQPGAVHS
jgi:DNA-binding response OmpR family regulator